MTGQQHLVIHRLGNDFLSYLVGIDVNHGYLVVSTRHLTYATRVNGHDFVNVLVLCDDVIHECLLGFHLGCLILLFRNILCDILFYQFLVVLTQHARQFRGAHCSCYASGSTKGSRQHVLLCILFDFHNRSLFIQAGEQPDTPL